MLWLSFTTLRSLLIAVPSTHSSVGGCVHRACRLLYTDGYIGGNDCDHAETNRQRRGGGCCVGSGQRAVRGERSGRDVDPRGRGARRGEPRSAASPFRKQKPIA